MRESSAQGKAAVVMKKIFLITPMPCHKPTFVAENKQKEKKENNYQAKKKRKIKLS